MKVSRSSWHYRWWNNWANDHSPYSFRPHREPRDLCSYFWGVVGPVVFCAGLAFIPISLLAYLGYEVFQYPWQALAVVLSFGIPIGGAFATKYLVDRRKGRPVGLVGSYLKARKQRICPLIEVVE